MRRASGKQQCELAQIKQLLADEKAENAKLREVIERQGLQNVVQLQEQIKSLKDEKVLLEIALDERFDRTMKVTRFSQRSWKEVAKTPPLANPHANPHQKCLKNKQNTKRKKQKKKNSGERGVCVDRTRETYEYSM